MKSIGKKSFLFILIAILIMPMIGGCKVEPDVADEEPEVEVIEEPVDYPEEVEEEPDIQDVYTPTDYYWPWLNHGQLALSSGEIIMGPDLFESDLGFNTEFTDGFIYEGKVVWLVEESDVFALEWLTLSFDVEYYEQNEWLQDIHFYLEVDDLKPRSGQQGLREYDVEIIKVEEGFEVAINKVLLGKEQEGMISEEPINYIALEMLMRAVENP
mgnify:CR=1 FL=1